MSVNLTWWQERSGIRYGRMEGRVTSGGCRLREPSGGHVWLWLNRTGKGLLWGKGERFMLQSCRLDSELVPCLQITDSLLLHIKLLPSAATLTG